MNHDKLAQRIVAQKAGWFDEETGKFYTNDMDYHCRFSTWLTAEQFCKDWRVAGALMEKVGECSVVRSGFGWVACVSDVGWGDEYSSLAIAIVDACLEALDQ